MIDYNHPNWHTTGSEKIFNPVVCKALVQRPTLAETRLEPPNFADQVTLSPYDLLLCYSENNLEKIIEIITDVSPVS